MTQVASIETYNEIESRFLESNVPTKSFYHDLYHKKLHLAYPEGADRAEIDELRRISAMHEIEFSVREELGISYPFPAYERVEEDGQIRLRAEGLGYIDEMFDPDGPRAADWPAARKDPNSINYKRAKTEHRSIVDFQNSDDLRNAKPGEVFVWTSPTVYDIHLNPHLSLEEKKHLLDKVCYGFHSFIFTYTVQENGDLQPQVHSTYFNPNGLRRLYGKAFGEEKEREFPPDEQLDMHLLGKIEKLPQTVEQFQQNIKDIEAEPDTQFELPEEVRKHDLEAHQVDEAMADTRPLAKFYYYLQRHASGRDIMDGSIQQLIDTAFQNWRKVTYARLGGGDPRELHYFRNLQEDALEALAKAQLAEARRLSPMNRSRFADQVYMPDVPAYLRAAAFHMDQLAANTANVAAVATGCGIGSGFSASEGTAALSAFTTTYEGASALLGGYGSSTETKGYDKVDNNACVACPVEIKGVKCGNKKNNKAFYKNGKIVGYACGKCGTSTMRA